MKKQKRRKEGGATPPEDGKGAGGVLFRKLLPVKGYEKLITQEGPPIVVKIEHRRIARGERRAEIDGK